MLHGGVGAAGRLGDTAQLVAGLGVRQQAEGVDGEVDALGGDVPRHLAGVERGAGVLAVRDEHDPAGRVAALEVVGRAQQGGSDGRPAGGGERGHRGLRLGPVQRADRVELPGVLAADLPVLAAVVGAEGAYAELDVVRHRVQHLVERLLRGGHPALSVDVAGPHRAADIERQLDLGGRLRVRFTGGGRCGGERDGHRGEQAAHPGRQPFSCDHRRIVWRNAPQSKNGPLNCGVEEGRWWGAGARSGGSFPWRGRKPRAAGRPGQVSAAAMRRTASVSSSGEVARLSRT